MQLPALIPLSDGRPGLRTLLPIEIREPSDSQPSTLNSQPVLDFVASDATLDRYGEIITPAGWHLDNYRRNPVFQNAHQHGDIIHTLGRALTTEIRSAPLEAPVGLSTLNSQPSTYLFQRIQFATDANPIARIAYALYKGHFLNAVSVGFVPLRWEDGDREPGASERGSVPRRRYLEQELLEVSAVAIPANPNALTLALKSGALDTSDLRHTLDLLRSLCATATPNIQPAPADRPTSPTSPPLNSCHSCHSCSLMSLPSPPTNPPIQQSTNPSLLAFARTLRDILRRT